MKNYNELDRDLLLNKAIQDEILKLVDTAKKICKTSKLTCLHNNSRIKQRFPAINFLRQILK